MKLSAIRTPAVAGKLVPSWWPRLHRETTTAWQRLAPRERRLLSLGGVVIALAFIWLVLFEPAWTTVRRLEASLPQLHAQSAQLDAILLEARELQRLGGGQGLPADQMLDEISASLERAGLAGVSLLSADKPQGPWEVIVESAPVAATLQWMQSLPFELRLRVLELDLQRAQGPDGRQLAGRLSGRLLLDTAQEQGS